MTKLYSKVQDLFLKCLACDGSSDIYSDKLHMSGTCPDCNGKGITSELSVGDVVEDKFKRKSTVWGYDGKILYIYSKGLGLHGVSDEGLQLKIKAITLSMVLDKLKKKEVLFFIGHGYTEGKSTMLTVESSAVRWQLRKNGKDLYLYDQSIELIKLVWEILS